MTNIINILVIAIVGCASSQEPKGTISMYVPKTVSSFQFINSTTTLDEIEEKLGSPDQKVGSGIYVYVYRLDDGSKILIGSMDGLNVLYVRHGTETILDNDLRKEKELPMYSDFIIKYPVKLSKDQEDVLNKLTDLKFMTKNKDIKNLTNRIKEANLPSLAKLSDLEVTDWHFKNISKYDVLLVVEHVTGEDLAIRTHWLKPDQFVTRSKMGTDLIYPTMKE